MAVTRTRASIGVDVAARVARQEKIKVSKSLMNCHARQELS
jgi:hypothetical protein